MFNNLKYKERNLLRSANPIISVILFKNKTYETKYEDFSGLVRLTTKALAFLLLKSYFYLRFLQFTQ